MIIKLFCSALFATLCFTGFSATKKEQTKTPFKSAKLCFEIKESKHINRNLLSGKWKLLKNSSIQKNGDIICENKGDVPQGTFVGVKQKIKLNQKQPEPISFSGESKCKNNQEEKLSYKYSIYLDICHTDGSYSKAVTAPFKNDSQDWKKAESIYTPEKPIAWVSFNVFYMNPGKAFFRNLTLTRTNDEKGEIFINGQKIGIVPTNESEKYQKVSVEIPKDHLSSIATANIINIENSSRKHGDLFTIKNIFLETIDANGNVLKSNIAKGPYTSFKTGFADLSNGEKANAYYGAPLPEIELTLPTDKIGYIKQAAFERKKGELYRDNRRKIWPGLKEAELTTPRKTMCYCRGHEFRFQTKEYLLDMLNRYNARIFCTYEISGEEEKLKYLKRHGIEIMVLYSCSFLRNPYDRLPESPKYKEFFAKLAKTAPHVDCVGMDEWFLSPAKIKTEGGHVTSISNKFIEAFAKWSEYSHEDAAFGFKNYKSNDPRTLKAWEYCEKIQNDLAKEFTRTAKKANPQVKTWTSYITRNWNKNATCIDDAIKGFDQLLQCQTYWYGRASKDSLNSPLVTAPIGMGKIFKAEYPDKFLWMGIDPFYTGGKGNREKDSWRRKHYQNTPAEATPYIALLYATSNGVYIQNFEGRQMLRFQLKAHPNPDLEYLSHLDVNGVYIDDFADVVNLVSRLVPYVSDSPKSDIAYYYDPDADWEIIRQRNRFLGSRETNEIAVGLLNRFCDVNVTKNIDKYHNVIYAGMLLPSKFDYEKQNIYLMFAPEYNEKGEKISEDQLFKKLDLKGFEKTMGKNFYLADYVENGCKDMIKISNMPQDVHTSGKGIVGASIPTRTASTKALPGKSYVIGARNKKGNILLNSLWPSFITQEIAERTIKEDLAYFKWVKRDCPQVNGKDKIVAVAFRKEETAILDFGQEASFEKIKLVIFNGKDGIVRNEIVDYSKDMKIKLPPLNVLVATGLK